MPAEKYDVDQKLAAPARTAKPQRRFRDAAVLGKAGEEWEHVHRLYLGGWSELGAAGEPDNHDGPECLRWSGHEQRKHIERLHGHFR
jgi:hypothetical protein